MFLIGCNETGLLLWFGDLEAAKAGWTKQLYAWKRLAVLVKSGEAAWSEYCKEDHVRSGVMAGAMVAAGQQSMIGELIQHTMPSDAMESYRTEAYYWEHPDGNCFFRFETMRLQTRALAAWASDEIDAGTLREWLPRPAQLIHIAQHEWMYCTYISGASHPSLLCGILYARLEEWDDAVAVAEGFLAIEVKNQDKIS